MASKRASEFEIAKLELEAQRGGRRQKQAKRKELASISSSSTGEEKDTVLDSKIIQDLVRKWSLGQMSAAEVTCYRHMEI